jgi:4-amino-4-deoxy-L-arabinose transferase-like glycosyltransferase
MLIWDLTHQNGNVFMNCDRANTRLIAIKSVLAAIGSSDQDVLPVLARFGIIGDYIFHSILYGAGGKTAVITVQVLLACIAYLIVFWLIFILTERLSASIAGALIYMHMPYSMIYPHMLSSEALFTPLIIFSFAALAFHLIKLTEGLGSLVASALLVGIASLIRPVALVWPFVVVLVYFTFARIRLNKLLIYLMVGLFPLFVWMSFMKLSSGEFSMGRSGHDLNHNLYGRVEYISRTMPANLAQEVRINFLEASPTPKQLSLPSYIAFVISYPTTTLKYYKNDLIAFSLKSGIEAAILDYMGYSPDFRASIRIPNSTWRRDMDKHGILYIIRGFFLIHPLLSSATMMGSLLMLALWIGYLLCPIRLFREREKPKNWLIILVLLLTLLPPYFFVTSTLANNVHSRHRAPAEFSIVILVIANFWGFSKKRNST